MVTEYAYHYWDGDFQNHQGKSLQQCFDEYGTGVQVVRPGVIMEVVFLDSRRTYGYSWMLRCFYATTGKNVEVRTYEAHRVPGVHPLNPLAEEN